MDRLPDRTDSVEAFHHDDWFSYPVDQDLIFEGREPSIRPGGMIRITSRRRRRVPHLSRRNRITPSRLSTKWSIPAGGWSGSPRPGTSRASARCRLPPPLHRVILPDRGRHRAQPVPIKFPDPSLKKWISLLESDEAPHMERLVFQSDPIIGRGCEIIMRSGGDRHLSSACKSG